MREIDAKKAIKRPRVSNGGIADRANCVSLSRNARFRSVSFYRHVGIIRCNLEMAQCKPSRNRS